MSDAYLGEIRPWAGIKCPQNWNFCDGSMLQINQYEPLFALIGTIYGGNGQTTFKLPDLRGRTPIGQGTGVAGATKLTTRLIGQTGGEATEQLSVAEMPNHTHMFNASTLTATTNVPGSTVMLASGSTSPTTVSIYCKGSPSKVKAFQLNDNALSSSSDRDMPHQNMMPSLAINFIICVQSAIFPQKP